MKILYIAPANSIHTYRWVKFFHEKGNEIILVSSEKPLFDFSFLDFYQIETPYKSFKLNMLKGIFKIFKIIRKLKPDIIHVHYIRRLGWIPAILNFNPLVITPWGSDLLQESAFENKLSKFLTKLSFKKSDLVTGDSYTLIKIAKDFGAKNTELITFGVEENKFFKLDNQYLKEKFSFPSDSFIILSPRALTPLYNTDKIVLAFAEISKIYNDIYLIVLDYNTNNNYKSELENLINTLNLSNKVKLMKELKHEDLNEIYNLSDLIVSIPTTDGTPATFFESMLCGIPIISINLTAYDGIVEDNKDILFINKLDVDLLGNKIETVYKKETDLDTIIRNGIATAKKNSFEMQMEKVVLLYQNLLKKNN